MVSNQPMLRKTASKETAPAMWRKACAISLICPGRFNLGQAPAITTKTPTLYSREPATPGRWRHISADPSTRNALANHASAALDKRNVAHAECKIPCIGQMCTVSQSPQFFNATSASLSSRFPHRPLSPNPSPPRPDSAST